MRHSSWGFVLLVSCGSLFGVVSCGGDGEDDSANQVEGGGGSTSATGGQGTIGTGGGSQGCTSQEDCGSSTVCHPYAGTCVAAQGACSSNADCAADYYCEPSLELCLPGAPGSPCESSENCAGDAECTNGTCGCSEFTQEQEGEGGPLDVYFVFDRTGSMGQDCEYVHGDTPPENSKACSATYALSDYLIDVSPQVDTRLAFQFLSYPNGCDGEPYSDALVDLTELPVAEDHQIIQEISDEDFSGGAGTDLEGALRGIAAFTAASQSAGREMIGVMMTDGDPEGQCEDDMDVLAGIIADHLESTGIRTFIIGMDGATEQNLEQLAIAGGAEPHDDFCGELEPPCHYWNVGDGSGDAIASALTAIQAQAVPLPCEYPLSNVTPPDDMTLDLSTLNVRLTEAGESTIIGRAESEAACPSDQRAWYYDNAANPTSVMLCPSACELVANAAAGASVSIVGGCQATSTVR